MPLNRTQQRWLTGLLLTAGLFLTRIPFISRTLFEFDSVDFALAAYRFDLAQVTPHMPGYIVHILLGRWLNLIFHDINLAYVWESILLSLGSLLFLWRAASNLRGERVGVVAAVLWLTTPVFWFYSEVATAYMHEAFFACVILYFGIRLLKDRPDTASLYLLLVSFSLSIGARQSSVMFFAPAVVYLLIKTRPSAKNLTIGVTLFAVVSALWFADLLYESGGLSTYLSYLGREHIYRSQSFLFGNSPRAHSAVMVKVLVYFASGAFTFLLIALAALISYPNRTMEFVRSYTTNTKTVFVLLVALPPFAFYVFIYFMKAGYLLNVIPSVAIVAAVLLDMMAIWNAERLKGKSPDKLLLTRPIITRFTITYLVALTLVNVIWFAAPLPGKERDTFEDAATRASFSNEITERNQGVRSKVWTLLNRMFGYSSLQAIKSMDAVNEHMISIGKDSGIDLTEATVLDTYWQRWGYFYHPKTLAYELAAHTDEDHLTIGRSYCYHRDEVKDTVIHLPQRRTIILIRKDHPHLKDLETQVRLGTVSSNPSLYAIEILDPKFRMKWQNVTFIRGDSNVAMPMEQCPPTLYK